MFFSFILLWLNMNEINISHFPFPILFGIFYAYGFSCNFFFALKKCSLCNKTIVLQKKMPKYLQEKKVEGNRDKEIKQEI